MSTFNNRTLQKRISLIPELIASAEATNQDIICIQEHRICNRCCNRRCGNSFKFAYKALLNIETISLRIMVATFQGNPETTIISSYSPTNVSEEEQVGHFYYDLSSLTRQILKHNLLVIG